MEWRNEQIYHLRQSEMLTKESQDFYFNSVIAKLFNQTKPDQILFSYLHNEECIGYGGLVHINWEDRNAEISFLMDTQLEKNNLYSNWTIFISMIEEVAFQELSLHKMYTYAFDLRPHLYQALEQCGFEQEARLKDHKHFEGKYIDVVIHGKTVNNS